MIEKNIFQTHKSMNYINSKIKVKNAISTWLKYTNEFKYYFYDDKMCDLFIKDNFNKNVYKAYSMLPMAVMKADLWRYCIIYKYGGIYADTDTVCNVNPNIFITDTNLVLVAENKVHLCQWVFAAPKHSPFLKEIIDICVHRILTTSIKGENIIHYLTGPGLFTDAIEVYLKKLGLITFENKTKYYKYPYSNIMCVFNSNKFHKNMVIHLFTGQDNDGWLKERDKKICIS